jgi:hypothetical protein
MSDSKPKSNKKIDKYVKEQHELLIKLNNILGITLTNNKFIICDIDESKQNQIVDLFEDVKRYIKCGTARICKQGVHGIQRPFLAIIKIIYKAANINLLHMQSFVERDDKKIFTGIYFVGDDA